MNLTELILNKNQIAPFIITFLLTGIMYKYLNRHYNISKQNIIPYPVLVCMIYVLFLIIYRIINTNTNFSKPLVNYLITKKNYKEEPYQINYVNPFVTNLDKVDFNMKRSTNKKYIKRILNELLIRKYVQFENVLSYNKNPWKIVKLPKPNNSNEYETENDGKISIYDNKYCKNYLNYPFTDNSSAPKSIETAEKQCLILYRKYIIQFDEKLYFIFEKKNKKDSKYFLSECISQIVVNSNTDYYSIIDTRDLHYDRQYVVFEDFPVSGDKTKKQWQRPDPTINPISDGYVSIKNDTGGIEEATSKSDRQDTINDKPTGDLVKIYNKFLDTPVNYYWQNDRPFNNATTNETHSKNIVDKWKNVYVIDIFFVYNDMVILDENRNILNSMEKESGNAENTADFSLNKYYNKRDWIRKKYYNFIRNQFNSRIPTNNLNVYLNDNINDISTVKFRNILGKNVFNVTKVDMKVYINRKKLDGAYTNEIILYEGSDKDKEIKINFEEYIRKYIQDKDVEPGELVIVKDKNTKYDENNSLVVDKSSIDYVSFNFLNIKNAEKAKKGSGRIEYKKKMSYIADQILKKYFESQLKSIDKIKYNVETLQIIQLDNLFRYNKGRNRLVLDGKIMTPNNIGNNFKDISRLRESYKKFLEQVLQYKKNLNKLIEENKHDLNVSNIKLLEIFNTNAFNTKSKFLGIIDKISNSEITSHDYTTAQERNSNTNNIKLNQAKDDEYPKSIVNGLNRKLVKLHILQKPNGYRKPSNIPLFVKFNAIVNINGFNINPNNVYIIHRTQNNQILKPQAIFLEEYLLEPDISNNKVKVIPASEGRKLLKTLKLYDCTNTFRKESIGVANVIKIQDKKRFMISFDNVPLEFKKLIGGDTQTPSDIYIDEPIFVMLNVSKVSTINEIKNNIYENQLYRVEKVQSTSLNTSANIIVTSNYDLDYTPGDADDESNFIYKDILVSQFINSKNYIENVFFKKVDIPREERALSSSPSISYQIALKKQIIDIQPPITRMEITSSKEKYVELMNKIIDYIYENEAKKIHYEIPEDIGIFKDTSAAVYSYKYKNELYVSYDKRNNPINYFKNTNSEYLCRKKYTGDTYFMNIKALYNLDSFNKYYVYFKNMFKNIIGLHDDINYECDEYYKSGKMIDRLKIPITFNKYVTFSTNFMLYYKNEQLLDDIDPSLIGKHIVINNNVLDNNLLNVNNSNRNNSNIYKRFIRDIIYTHDIGGKGFEYDDAKKICERIFTVYDKKCKEPTYKLQGDDYNIDFYKRNKTRDECFNIVYNTEKEMNNEQFIAKIKGFDPTAEFDDVRDNAIHDYHPDNIKINTDSIYNIKTESEITKIGKDSNKSPFEIYNWLNYMINKKGHEVELDGGSTNDSQKNGYGIWTSKKNTNHIYLNWIWIPPSSGTTSLTADTTFKFAIDIYGYTLSQTKSNKNEFTIALDTRLNPLIKYNWLKEKIDKYGDLILFKKKPEGVATQYYIWKIILPTKLPSENDTNFTFQINNNKKDFKYSTGAAADDKTTQKKGMILSDIQKINPDFNDFTGGNYRFYKGTYNLKKITDKLEENKWKTDNDVAIKEYAAQVKALEKIGNIEVKPHRLAELNEIKTAAWYNAEWDSIAWINDSNPILQNKSNLVKVKDNKVMWFDKDDPNAKNKGVVCYGRKLDQNKLAQNKQNELFNFQMERIEQNIKDLQKYENVSKFNKEVYSRWNL